MRTPKCLIVSERLRYAVESIQEVSTDISSYKQDYQGKAYRYVHFWYNKGHWRDNDFCAHLHDHPNSNGKSELEVCLGIYCDRYEGCEQLLLLRLVDQLAELPHMKSYKFDRKGKKLILKKSTSFFTIFCI